MLQNCGELRSWKRFLDASGQPKDGGIADFETVEGVFTCGKFLHNMVIGESRLLVKANQRTQAHIDQMRETRRQEYCDYLETSENPEKASTAELLD